MTKILGLDLGTNSIGWAVVEKSDGEFNLLDKGVRIFQEGVKKDAGPEKSRAAERTAYRSARRLKFRRKLRKYYTLLVLSENSMCPLSLKEIKEWRYSGFKNYPTNKDFLKWLSTDDNINKNPYYFRDKFSRKKYNWETSVETAKELGRAFYHLAQRRGFKSNRLEQTDENVLASIKKQVEEIIYEVNIETDETLLFNSLSAVFEDFNFDSRKKKDLDVTENKIYRIYKHIFSIIDNTYKNKKFKTLSEKIKEIDVIINKSENQGVVKEQIDKLSNKIKNSKECETLGQYFYVLYKSDRNSLENKIRNQYTDREEHYEKEFEHICKLQNISGSLKEKLYKAIFYQRPLKSQKGLVGKCIFELNKPRCPISHPTFEEFRMLSFINNIKIKTPETYEMRRLNKDEIQKKVIPKFYRFSETFKFSDILKAIEPKATFCYHKDTEAKDADYLVNFPLDTVVSGCPVSARLKSIMGDDWKTKTYNYKTVNKKGEVKYHEVGYIDLWHVLFSFNDENKIKDYARIKLGFSDVLATKFSRIILKQGYSNLSLKAMNNILCWLNSGYIYSHAVFLANLHKVIDKDVWSNQELKENIIYKVQAIVDNASVERKITIVLNKLISNYKTNLSSYAKEKEDCYRNELIKEFKDIYGVKTWDNINDDIKNDILKNAFDKLVEHLMSFNDIRNTPFLKLPQKEDLIKTMLIKNNYVADCGIDNNGMPKRIHNLYHPSNIARFKPENAKNKNKEIIFENGEPVKILPLPKTDAIKNPVLMRAMHQLRKVVNELIISKTINPQTRVHIELAREVNDANQRAAWKKWQDENRDNRLNAINEIKKLYSQECGKEVNPTEDDIIRYLLWEEQKRKEIYETTTENRNNTNISICDIIGPNPKYDIEHTIPRSMSWDNSRMNKTLCSKEFNRDTKKNKLPSQLGNHKDILEVIKHWRNSYKKLENEIKSIRIGSNLSKESKDKLIQKRHYLKFKHDYLKGKYERFTMTEVPSGFKNSQLVDTGLISRFAREYLSCLFRTESDNSNVRVVKGQIVSEFRKAWGIQEAYGKKFRDSHLHHCIDAITIACMTTGKYDSFTNEWRNAEELKVKHEQKHKINIPKPWNGFVQDIKNLENEVLVVHHFKDTLPKQSKKIERKRGKKQYLIDYKIDSNGVYLRDIKGNKIPKKDTNGKIVYIKDEKGDKIPKYQQGDTVRGSLHNETFYGVIKMGKNTVSKDYVYRKEISKLKPTDIAKIVDENIKKIIESAIKEKLLEFNKNGAKLNGIIWQNKEKGIPIKKVRIKSSLKFPIEDFKKHAKPFLSRNAYKQQFNVKNNGNYLMAIYEGTNAKEKVKRDFEIRTNLESADFFKLSVQKNLKAQGIKGYEGLLPLTKTNGKLELSLKSILKIGTMVILWEKSPEEVWELEKTDIKKRLYKVVGITTNRVKSGKNWYSFGMCVLRHHQVAIPASELKTQDGLFRSTETYIAQRKFSHNQFNALVEGVDFKLTTLGEIIKIEK